MNRKLFFLCSLWLWIVGSAAFDEPPIIATENEAQPLQALDSEERHLENVDVEELSEPVERRLQGAHASVTQLTGALNNPAAAGQMAGQAGALFGQSGAEGLAGQASGLMGQFTGLFGKAKGLAGRFAGRGQQLKGALSGIKIEKMIPTALGGVRRSKAPHTLGSVRPKQVMLGESTTATTSPPNRRRRPGEPASGGQNVPRRPADRIDVNYMHVTIDDQTPGSKLSVVTDYLRQYLGVKSTETLSVEEMTIGRQRVLNRFKVIRIDRATQRSREFTVDVDFEDGNNDKSIYKTALVVSLTSQGLDRFYLNDYEHTLQTDCEAIRQELHDPVSIECTPFVNQHRYVLPQMYRVRYSVMRGGKEVPQRARLAIVSYSNAQIALQPVQPRKRQFVPTALAIRQLVRHRIDELPFFRGKEVVLREIQKPDFLKKVDEYEAVIKAFETRNRKRLELAEKQYQRNLRVALARSQVSQEGDEEGFTRTYDIMREKSEEVNAFNIRTAIKRALVTLEEEQIYQVYRARVRHYRRESILTDLLDRMDYMRYLADKHLDDNFEHYHTAAYFKKE